MRTCLLDQAAARRAAKRKPDTICCLISCSKIKRGGFVNSVAAVGMTTLMSSAVNYRLPGKNCSREELNDAINVVVTNI
jgi:hypothetical protein